MLSVRYGRKPKEAVLKPVSNIIHVVSKAAVDSSIDRHVTGMALFKLARYIDCELLSNAF